MKKTALWFVMAVMAILSVSLTSCKSDASAQVDKMVEMFDSKEFEREVTSQGLFTTFDCKRIDEAVEFNFTTIPGISMAGVTEELTDARKALFDSLLREHMQKDKDLRNGLRAMSDLHLMLVVNINDQNGNTATFRLDPSDLFDGAELRAE